MSLFKQIGRNSLNKRYITLIFFGFILSQSFAQRPRELGIKIGLFSPGKFNSITDVAGVKVGHVTVIEGNDIRTGVTAILPHSGDLFMNKTPAAIFQANGFGKLSGISQVRELGNIETPIFLTNTLSVGTGMKAAIQYTLELPGHEKIGSVNAVVGETNDGFLNDIRQMYLRESQFLKAIEVAKSGAVTEGNIGAGTGTTCFGYKGGIGTSSRKLPDELGGYTVGVLVQTNFGGNLTIDGVPVGVELGNYQYKQILDSQDGSCMMIIATDAPIDARNLERLAKRAFLGLGRTGGTASNGSGDYVIAFSNYKGNLVPDHPDQPVQIQELLSNDAMSPLFMAAIESTEEAIINSLFAAEKMKGNNGNTREKIPVEEVMKIMKKYKRVYK